MSSQRHAANNMDVARAPHEATRDPDSSENDDLLSRLAGIVEVVNAFRSPEVQLEAFRLLVGGGSVATARGNPKSPRGQQGGKPTRRAVKPGVAEVGKSTSRRSTGAKKATFQFLKDLDLQTGDEPFEQFVARKAPKNNVDKCVVAIYWLQRLANLGPISIHHVYTCFKDRGWPLPADLANTLQQAGTHGYLDSADRDDLKVVVRGENHVEHQLGATGSTI